MPARLPGTAGHSGWGEEGEAPGGWGLARAANGTQLDPPARQEEGGRTGRGLQRWQRRQDARPTPGLAALPSPSLPLAPRQVSERARRDPACPELPCKGLWRQAGGRGVRPFKSQAWSLKGLPCATPFPFPRWASRRVAGLGGGEDGDPPPQLRSTRDVAATQASLVSFFQFLSLTFPVSLFSDRLNWGEGAPSRSWGVCARLGGCSLAS